MELRARVEALEAKVAARRAEVAVRAANERRWRQQYTRPGLIAFVFALGVGACLGAGYTVQTYDPPAPVLAAPLENGCADERALYNRGWQQCRSEQDDLGIPGTPEPRPSALPRCICIPGDPLCSCE